MFSGRYVEALAEFALVLGDEALTRPQWRLKRRALTFLVDTLGLNSQERRTREANARAEDDALDVAGLREVLSIDLLCGEALYRIGHLCAASRERSVEWFLASAMFEPWSADAWLGALAHAPREWPEGFEDVALCARRYCREEVVRRLLEEFSPGTAEAFEDYFEQLPAEPRYSAEIRITTPGVPEYGAIGIHID